MAFAPGESIGPYRVAERLGADGMGEVYRAHDPRLQRTVALKIVRQDKLRDSESRRRLTQEARAISSLKHPHIVGIYDILTSGDADVLVMEYIEGRGLDEAIPPQGLRVSQALRWGKEIADALAAAHAAGVIHRDLKPSNIIVTTDGSVKLLDFGLAKSFGKPATEGETLTDTVEGTVTGTVSYMSPEQAEGKTVDGRTDIFSFGCVLYEMVTGQRAFSGSSALSILSAVLRDEPPPAGKVTRDVPEQLDRIISRCLRKDPNRRFQHFGDVAIVLEDVLEAYESQTHSSPERAVAAPRRWPVWTAAAAVLLFAAGLTFVWARRRPAVAEMRITPLTTLPGFEVQPSFSPDGTQVAFAWAAPGQQFDIYVQVVGAGDPVRLTHDPASEYNPVWSPDGRTIAFVRQTGDEKQQLMIIPALGGTERRLADLNIGPASRTESVINIMTVLAWTPDSKWIVFARRATSNDAVSLWAMSPDSGQMRRLTSPRADSPGDRSPAFSADGLSLFFARFQSLASSEIYRLRLTPEMTPAGEAQLTSGEADVSCVLWTRAGDLLYVVDRNGVAGVWKSAAEDASASTRVTPFGSDVITLTAARGGSRFAFGRALFDHNLYRIPVHGGLAPVQLFASSVSEHWPAYAPDGTRIAFQSDRSGVPEIWLGDLASGRAMQLTRFGRGHSGMPRWSPDGRAVVFDSNIPGHFEIYVMDVEGGTPTRLTESASDSVTPSYSPDGNWIYFARVGREGSDIYRMPAGGGASEYVAREAVPLWSPDGKWLYFRLSLLGLAGPLMRMPAGSGQPEQVLESVMGRAFAVGRYGVYYVFQGREGESGIRLLNPETRISEALHPLPRTLRVPERWLSPPTSSGSYTASPILKALT